MIVINSTRRDIHLPSGHILKVGENKNIPKSVRTHPDNRDFLDGEERARRVEFRAHPNAAPQKPPEPEEEGDEITRATVAAANRVELEAIARKDAGMTDDDIKGIRIEDSEKHGEGLRTKVARALFDGGD